LGFQALYMCSRSV